MIDFDEHSAATGPSVQERLIGPTEYPSDIESDYDNSLED